MPNRVPFLLGGQFEDGDRAGPPAPSAFRCRICRLRSTRAWLPALLEHSLHRIRCRHGSLHQEAATEFPKVLIVP